MSESLFGPDIDMGTPELQLPDELRAPVRAHLEKLRAYYMAANWARRSGFGVRPAVVVVDLALNWTRPGTQMGSNVEPVVEGTRSILTAARSAAVPILFSTSEFDPDELTGMADRKVQTNHKAEDAGLMEIDPRLERRPDEKIFTKRWASCFAGTALRNMLTALKVDTVIVTGVSTSHCVYATCRDASSSFRVVIPREAVGERCQIMHWTFLLDLDINVGDVMPVDEVLDYFGQLSVG